MKPYSKDLRLRVLSAVDAGTPRQEVATTFSVSVPTIKRWLKRRRETGDVQPRAIPGRPSRKGKMLKEWLPHHLQANDDLTLEHLANRVVLCNDTEHGHLLEGTQGQGGRCGRAGNPEEGRRGDLLHLPHHAQ